MGGNSYCQNLNTGNTETRKTINAERKNGDTSKRSEAERMGGREHGTSSRVKGRNFRTLVRNTRPAKNAWQRHERTRNEYRKTEDRANAKRREVPVGPSLFELQDIQELRMRLMGVTGVLTRMMGASA